MYIFNVTYLPDARPLSFKWHDKSKEAYYISNSYLLAYFVFTRLLVTMLSEGRSFHQGLPVRFTTNTQLLYSNVRVISVLITGFTNKILSHTRAQIITFPKENDDAVTSIFIDTNVIVMRNRDVSSPDLQNSVITKLQTLFTT